MAMMSELSTGGTSLSSTTVSCSGGLFAILANSAIPLSLVAWNLDGALFVGLLVVCLLYIL
jgi:hypothetical protein